MELSLENDDLIQHDKIDKKNNTRIKKREFRNEAK